jgi:acyl carrier protein
MTIDTLTAWLQAEVSRLLELPPNSVAPDASLLELGLDSLAAERLCAAIADKAGIDVDPMLVFDYPTIAQIVTYLRGQRASGLSD